MTKARWQREQYVLKQAWYEELKRWRQAIWSGKKVGEANKEIEVIKSRQLGYDEGKANKEDCAKQRQMEAYEEVLKEYKKRDKNIPIMPKYMRDLDFDKFLEQRIKELKKK